jgi:hypothetical protein
MNFNPADLNWQKGPLPDANDVPTNTRIVIFMEYEHETLIVTLAVRKSPFQVGNIHEWFSVGFNGGFYNYTAVRGWAIISGATLEEIVIKEII